MDIYRIVLLISLHGQIIKNTVKINFLDEWPETGSNPTDISRFRSYTA